jgi:alkylhydroperoxidase/carboxymuconolactone decarboxylase family protein YurZ
MSNIKPVNAPRFRRLKAASALALGMVLTHAPATSGAEPIKEKLFMQNEQTLSASRQAIGPIAAFAAAGDLGKLKDALEHGLDAGLTVSECKELLVQLYAYAGFPRSLNALTGLMQVLEERKRRGIVDAPGSDPAPALTGEALLASGTANQTKLVGAPVKGPVFEFAPAIDQFLKTHLFGDIFNRDNLDWHSRELATVAALASLSGLEAQLQSHVKMSMNVGISEAQLRQFIQVLATRVDTATAQRAQAALDTQLASR